MAEADLVVFNYYNEDRASALLEERAASGRPWCFWGERPGARQYGWFGESFRRWALATLRRSQAPIWGIGRFAVEQYRREFSDGRAYVNLPYFSNLDRFRSERPAARVREGCTTFLFSGALIPRKGVDLLAAAFLRLAAERRDVRLRVMGSGELDHQMKATLAPVADRVEFMGFRDWDELPDAYHAADVLCAPSRYDGWALVVPEALAAGLPVVGTDRTGAALEFIQPCRNGWLLPTGDVDALHRAMRDAADLTDADLAAYSHAARQSVSSHSLSHGAARFLDAAHSALGGWNHAAAKAA